MNPLMQQMHLTYVDRPEIFETFVDLLERVSIHAS